MLDTKFKNIAHFTAIDFNYPQNSLSQEILELTLNKELLNKDIELYEVIKTSGSEHTFYNCFLKNLHFENLHIKIYFIPYKTYE